MLNAYATSWEIDEARVQAIFAIGGLAPPREQPVLLEMINSAKSGEKVWEVTAERIVSIRSAILGARRPTADAIKKVAQQMRAGGVSEGVADRPWFDAAVRMLETLANLSP